MKTLLRTSFLLFFGVELTTLSWNTVDSAPMNDFAKNQNEEGAVLPDGYKLSLCARVASQRASGMLVCTNKNDGPVLLTVSQVQDLSQFNPVSNKLPPQGKYLISPRGHHFVPSFPRFCSPLQPSATQAFLPSGPLNSQNQLGGLFECHSNLNNNNTTMRLAVTHHLLKNKRWVEVMLEDNGEDCDDSEDTPGADGRDNKKPAGGVQRNIVQPLLFIGKISREVLADTQDQGPVQAGFQNRDKDGPAIGDANADEPVKDSLTFAIHFMEAEEDESRLRGDSNERTPVVDADGAHERNDCNDEHDPNCDLEGVRSEDN